MQLNFIKKITFKINSFKFISGIVMVLFFNTIVAANMVLAQVSGGVNIELTPENPKTGDTYTARIYSYSIDVDKSNIVWSIDGQSVDSGFGNKQIKLIKKNKNELLGVKITTPSGDIYNTTKTLGINTITLIYEGLDSYTPYWYKGKRGLASGGKVRVVAIPNITDVNGKQLNKEEMSYVWEINNEIIQSSTGFSKYYADLDVIEEYGNKVLIRVTVSPKDSDIKVSDSINIYTETASLLAYEEVNNNIIPKPLSILNTDKKEVTVSVEPFFFSTDRNKNTELEYNWNINFNDNSGSYKRSFKLGDQSGYSNIEITAKNSNLNKLFQSASTKLRINF